MLHWKTPEIADYDWVVPLLPKIGIAGSDTAFASLFVWRNMYCLQITQHRQFLLRRMNCILRRRGYAFPIGVHLTGNDLRETIEILAEESAQHHQTLKLYAVPESGKNELESLFPNQFIFSHSPDDSDYIYKRSDLAELVGRKYHRIRNHIAKFHRQYPEAEYQIIEKNNLNDVADVEKHWHEEHQNTQNLLGTKMLHLEHHAFTDALDHFEELQLRGVILYCEGNPVAVCIASAINEEICNVHFEKAIKPYAEFGAFAVVRNHLAKMLNTFQQINLEEDMGLAGLRKAKQAWQPIALFPKYKAVKK